MSSPTLLAGNRPDHAVGGQPPLVDDLVEHRLGVVVELARRLAGRGAVEDVGERPLHLPGVEERLPVDVAAQVVEVVALEDPHVLGPAPATTMGETAWSCWRSRCGRGGRYDDQSIGVARSRACSSGPSGGRSWRRGGSAASRSRPCTSASSFGRRVVAQQRGRDRHRPRGVLHPDHRAVVLAVDLDRGVGARRRRAADQQRDGELLALHLGGEVDHLVQRRGDQAGEPDHVGADLAGGVEDLLRRHHHAEVDDLVVVALEHHADDVLADVVDVALDGRHHDRAVGVLGGGELGVVELLLLDEGDQVGDGLLHHPRRLHHLGQEHLAGAEEVADDVHAVHQRALDDLDRAAAALGDGLAQLLGVVLDEAVDALDEGVGDPLAHRQRAPLLLGLLDHLAGPVVALGDLEQPLGRVGAAVEDDVLDPLAELGLDLVVDHESTGVDDAHVEVETYRAVGDALLEAPRRPRYSRPGEARSRRDPAPRRPPQPHAPGRPIPRMSSATSRAVPWKALELDVSEGEADVAIFRIIERARRPLNPAFNLQLGWRRLRRPQIRACDLLARRCLRPRDNLPQRLAGHRNTRNKRQNCG